MKNWRNKKALLLTRVSTTDQKDNGYSLPQQKDLLYDFCSKHDINIVEYLEEDFTGTTLDRPQIKRMRNLIKSKKIDLVLFHKWDRFSRVTSQGLAEVEQIQSQGVEINAIAEYIDFKVPQQKMMLFMYFGLGEVENAVRSQRTKNGIIGALKEGRHVNKAPIGYINSKDPKFPSKPLIKPCEYKAPLIRAIFNEYATGLHTQEYLRKKYSKLGIVRSKSQFSKMLSNILYIGKIVVPEHDGLPIEIREALHEQIVDFDVFHRVQKIKFGKANIRIGSKKNNKREEDFPLRGGILKCSKCGKNLTGSRSKSRNGNHHYYYHCNSKEGCGERFKTSEAHSELIKILNDLEPKQEILDLFKEVLIDYYKTNKTSKLKALNKANSDKKKIEYQLDRLVKEYIQGNIKKPVYDRLEEKYTNRINDLNFSINEYSDSNKDIEVYIDFSIHLLSKVNILFQKANTEIKRKIIGSIFQENLIFENGKYRTTKFNDAINLMFNKISKLKGVETKKRQAISNLSCSVAGTGLEPVTFGL